MFASKCSEFFRDQLYKISSFCILKHFNCNVIWIECGQQNNEPLKIPMPHSLKPVNILCYLAKGT